MNKTISNCKKTNLQREFKLNKSEGISITAEAIRISGLIRHFNDASEHVKEFDRRIDVETNRSRYMDSNGLSVQLVEDENGSLSIPEGATPETVYFLNKSESGGKVKNIVLRVVEDLVLHFDTLGLFD